jgi:hypothetical protein
MSFPFLSFHSLICITDAHSLREITEKMGARGGACALPAHPFFMETVNENVKKTIRIYLEFI